MKKILLFAALTAGIGIRCFGQIYNLSGGVQFGPGVAISPGGDAATYTGALSIDAGNGTLSASGTGFVPAFKWAETDSKITTIPGRFPNPTTMYTDTLVVDYTSTADPYSFSFPPAIPHHNGGNQYVLSHLQSLPGITVNYDYKLTENGSVITSGSGTYQLSGTISTLTVDVTHYPGAVSSSVSAPVFTAEDAPILNLIAPHGQFIVYPGVVSAVPEPADYAAAFCVGSLIVGMGIRKLRSARAGVSAK